MDLHLINEGRHEQLWTCSAPTCTTTAADRRRSPARRSRCGRRTRARRPAQGRLQQLGRPRAPDAPARQSGRVGAVRARRRHRHQLQVRRSSAPTASGARRPTRWRSTPRSPPATSSVVFESDLHVGRRRLDERARRPAAGRTRPMSVYEVHLGSWRSGTARSDYDRAGRRAGPLRRRPRLHPRRADAGDGAPVRRLVGLPRHVVLRPDCPLRRPRRLPAARRPAAPGRHRRDPRLGARPLRQGRVGAGPLRRHAALRGPEPAARLAPGVGLPHLQLRPPRGAQLPRTPTRSTGSRSSTPTACASTASPRCSTSTTPARRASGRRTCTAAARTSRRCSSSRR